MTLDQYNNLKREADVVNKIRELLMSGQFRGVVAQDVAIGQMYLQGLYKAMSVEIEKNKAEHEPLDINEPFKAGETKAEPVVADSAKG